MNKKQENFIENLAGGVKLRPTVGLLLENMVGRGDYQTDILSGVSDIVRKRGANLVCFAGGTLSNSLSNVLENMQNVVYDLASMKNVDGLIISGTLGTFISQEEFGKFVKRFEDLPIVSTVMSLPNIPSVMVDNEKGMREMLLHLIREHGYQKIGFIRGPENNPDAEQRYKVYKAVLAEQGIMFDQNLVVSGDFMLSSGALALDELLKKAEPDALVAANDNMALGALEALRGWHINVPYKIAVTGFDDMRGSRDVTPPLTTVYYPAYEQGQQAAEMLLALLSGKEIIPQETLSTKLKLRESCGCLDPMVGQAKVGLSTKQDLNIKTGLETSREKILLEVEEKIPNIIRDIEYSGIQELLDAFYLELREDNVVTIKKGFLSILDEILGQVTIEDGNVSDWHGVISFMRRNMLPFIRNDQVLSHAEDLWQQARVMIGKRSRRAEGYKRLQAGQRTAKLNELTQDLDTTSDLTELMTILTKGLKNLGIAGCYLSMYEKISAPISKFRLILGYERETGPIQLINNDQIFPVEELIPSTVFSQDTSYNLIVEPLYCRENRLGVIVFKFETEPYEGDVYETLRSQISSALWRVHITQYLQSLSEASTHVMGIQEPDAILQEVVDQACQTMGALSAHIILVDKNREVRRLIIGGEREKSAGASNKVGEIALEAIEKKEPVLVPNTNNHAGSQEIAKMGLHAAGCFPLVLRGKSIGAMWIYYEKPHSFLSAEKIALKLYVNQAAMAYDNVRRMKELEHLQQASEKLASVADVREVIQQIAESAHDVLEADSVAIWSYDESRKAFLPEELVTEGISDELVKKSKLHKPRPYGTAAAVMREGYLAVTDINNAKFKYLGPQAHGLRGAIGVKSFQGIVLKASDEVLGVLYVNYKTSREFDEEEEATLKTFAYHAALALKKARLLERLSRVHQAARIVATESVLKTLEEILKAIAHSTESALGCDAVILYTYDQEKDEIEFPPAMSGVKNKAQVLKIGYVDKNSLNYKIINLDKLHVAEDATTDPLVKGPFVKREHIKSSVSIPLVVADRKVGVMFVNYRTPHHFNDEELADIELFAHQAAVAIRNAQLHAQATRKAQYLQALNEAGKAVTSTLALDEILKSIAEQASLLLKHQDQQPLFCNLALKENNILIFKVCYSASDILSSVKEGYSIDLEHDQPIGIVGRVITTHKSQLILDVTQDPDYIPGSPKTKSILAVPITIGEEFVGVIAVGHSSYNAFDVDDQDCLESLSTQAALAIRNARLYQETKTRAAYLQALYEAGKIVTSTLALDEILEHIVEQASLITGQKGQQAQFCYLTLHEKGRLSFKATFPPSPHQPRLTELISKIDLEHDERIGIVGRTIKEGKSHLAADVRKDPDYIEVNPETRSELAVPIKRGKDVIGAIAVEHSNYSVFDWEDAQALEALADQAAIALENARQVKEIGQHALQMQIASEIARHAASILNIEQLLNQAVKLISDHFNFQHAAIFLLEKEFAFLKAASSEGGQKMLADGHKLKLGIGIVGYVAKTGKPRIAFDVDKDSDFFRNHHLPDTRSEMALPLHIHGELIGVLDIQSMESTAFSMDDIIVLQMMVDQLAIAIRNAQQYEELKKTKGLVGASTALAWMGMASNTWRHTIDKHARTIVEQVDHLHKELSQIFHDNGYSKMDGRLAMIQRLARQIEEKPITPPLSSEEGVVSVQVNILIRERTERLWESDPYRAVTLHLNLVLDDRLTIRASPEWLRRALDILIDNAIDAMIDSPHKRIVIETRQKDKWIEILMRDTGKGISDAVSPYIFVESIKKIKGAKGLGVGLLLAQVIVQTYDGEIGVDSTDSTGTTMFIRLPLES